MTIQIENNGPHDDPDSPSNYSVRIKGKEVCEFSHRRTDGLSKCLLRAAVAFEQAEAKRISQKVIIQPSNLRPFVEDLFRAGAVVLNVEKKKQSEGEIGHSGSYSCHDVESLLRCLSEYKNKTDWKIVGISFLPFTSLVQPSKGQWVFERSSGYSGYRCQKCAEWVYEEQELECKCDKENDT